ncbi:hypothetical protein CDD81_8134 [Ophiocordyceps australis]|uniref:Myb-like domain-containing protein n=1 Tax=Ophiocordyceps australis TaxID=1399860 RepID=A0A2C5X8Q9_9HYPO|nr:hypothetical protein CDD81_8134 [Ophiocordyceps australis]
MSQTQMISIHTRYSPIKDVMHRRDGGVVKGKKIAMTGSGRAWREDEEAYLLQTRLQKMPYKHIAAHLNKTELACRLHYHQLSHGSTRRKRTTSCSSGSSDRGVMAPSPSQRCKSRSLSPTQTMSNYVPVGGDMQLPSIMSTDRSPRLPAILPKPESLGYVQSLGEPPQRYHPLMVPEHPSQQSQGYQQQPPFGFRQQASYQQPAPISSPGPLLRLDCSGLSPPSASVRTPPHVDLSRLHSIYETHRNSFWTAIADEYGPSVSPVALEQAWRSGVCCTQHGGGPMTPMSSPDSERRRAAAAPYRGPVHDKTRISSILGVDMEPRLR